MRCHWSQDSPTKPRPFGSLPWGDFATDSFTTQFPFPPFFLGGGGKPGGKSVILLPVLFRHHNWWTINQHCRHLTSTLNSWWKQGGGDHWTRIQSRVLVFQPALPVYDLGQDLQWPCSLGYSPIKRRDRLNQCFPRKNMQAFLGGAWINLFMVMYILHVFYIYLNFYVHVYNVF